MKVRITNDDALYYEMGEPKSVTLFGHVVTQEYTDVNVSKEAEAKIKANKFFETSGENDPKKAEDLTVNPDTPPTFEEDPEDELDNVRADLDALSVEYDGRLGLTKLKALLKNAQRAAAKPSETDAI